MSPFRSSRQEHIAGSFNAKAYPSLGSLLSLDAIKIECLRRFRKAKKIDLRKFSYDLNLSRC